MENACWSDIETGLAVLMMIFRTLLILDCSFDQENSGDLRDPIMICRRPGKRLSAADPA